MLKDDKGFTLVELLATIVIIGVVMAIVIPTSYGYIEKSRRKAFYINVKGIVDQVKKKNELEEIDSDVTVCYSEDTTCTSKTLSGEGSNVENKDDLIKSTEDMDAITVITYIDRASGQRKYAVTASSSDGKYEITETDFYAYNYTNDDKLEAPSEDKKQEFEELISIEISKSSEVSGS